MSVMLRELQTASRLDVLASLQSLLTCSSVHVMLLQCLHRTLLVRLLRAAENLLKI